MREGKLAILLVLGISFTGFSQKFHRQAHAHNDYEHARPLMDALSNGFAEVEADVHLQDGMLRVAHISASAHSPLLQRLYLDPLDSIIRLRGHIIPDAEGSHGKFFLMIDIKTAPEATWLAIRKLLQQYPQLQCTSDQCRVVVFISGNRPAKSWKEKDPLLLLDGRPEDLGKGITPAWMPVISDNYANWCDWDGRRPLTAEDMVRIRALSEKAHAEGKRLRLWAIPDHPAGWEALLANGVDIINSDHLEELHAFLEKR